jgi:hypothetical protein
MIISQLYSGKLGFSEFSDLAATIVKFERTGEFISIASAFKKIENEGNKTVVFIGDYPEKNIDILRLNDSSIYRLAVKLRKKDYFVILVTQGDSNIDVPLLTEAFNHVIIFFNYLDVDVNKLYPMKRIRDMQQLPSRSFAFFFVAPFVDLQLMSIIQDRGLSKEKIFLVPALNVSKEVHRLINEAGSILELLSKIPAKEIYISKREDVEIGKPVMRVHRV